MAKKCDLWGHNDIDLWPSNSDQFIYESKWTFMPNAMKFPPGVPDIPRSHRWDRYEVTGTLTFWPLTTKVKSARLWVQVNVYAKFEEIPSRRSWDIVFMGMGWTNGKTWKHKAYRAKAVVSMEAWKSIAAFIILLNMEVQWRAGFSLVQPTPSPLKRTNWRIISCYFGYLITTET